MPPRIRSLLPAGPLPMTASAPIETFTGKPTRRSSRACDACRQRKIRCDGPRHAGRVCTYCTRRFSTCTYSAESQRPAEHFKYYVKSLEDRVAKIENLLRERHPGVNIARELAALSVDESGDETVSIQDEVEESSDEELCLLTRLSDTTRLDIEKGYFGRSSLISLVHTIAEEKEAATGTSGTRRRFPKRLEFWRPPKHEYCYEDVPSARPHVQNLRTHLPPPDVLKALVDLYFSKLNVSRPLLHRPLFELMLRINLDDNKFVALVLLVCACGSRFTPDNKSRLSVNEKPPGWQYFELAEPYLRTPTPAEPRLYDLQIYMLAFNYLSSTVVQFTASWTVLGMAIRVAYQVGAHRARVYKETPNLIDELWKRAFWMMLVIDRHMTLVSGNPTAMPHELFDVGLPLDYDENAWDLDRPEEHYPLKAPTPTTGGSQVAILIQLSKLALVIGKAVRSLYSISRPHTATGKRLGNQQEKLTRNELVASLEEWLEALPLHLKWDPLAPDAVILHQSAVLHTAYYHAKLVINNPFPFLLPEKGRRHLLVAQPGAAVTSTLAACTSAAHGCSRILAVQLQRGVDIHPHQILFAFGSALIMFANLWGSRARMTNEQKVKAGKTHSLIMADISVCIDAVKWNEHSWDPAARIWDILTDLSSPHHPDANVSPVGMFYERASMQPNQVEHPRQGEQLDWRNWCALAGPGSSQDHSSVHAACNTSPSTGTQPATTVAPLARDTQLPCLAVPGSCSYEALTVMDLSWSANFGDLPGNLQLALSNTPDGTLEFPADAADVLSWQEQELAFKLHT